MMARIILSIKKKNKAKDNYLILRDNYLSYLKKLEVLGAPFYDKLGQLNNFYLPICASIFKDYISKKKIIVVGLSGGQGSGKTTISQILKLILKIKYNLNTVTFSIDDFYKSLKERKKMSKKIHKLFITRGVPGTHDTKLLMKVFKGLLKKKYKTLLLPKFNKASDDRLPKKQWKKIKKKPNIIIFEGWCVGAKHQTNKALKKPINNLESKEDPRLIWRKKANNELKNIYNNLFNLIDKLIFLKVPNFKYIYKWRLLQEKKLMLKYQGKKVMNKFQIKKFIMFYERISKEMMKSVPNYSDIIILLDKKHRLQKIRFK